MLDTLEFCGSSSEASMYMLSWSAGMHMQSNASFRIYYRNRKERVRKSMLESNRYLERSERGKQRASRPNFRTERWIEWKCCFDMWSITSQRRTIQNDFPHYSLPIGTELTITKTKTTRLRINIVIYCSVTDLDM